MRISDLECQVCDLEDGMRQTRSREADQVRENMALRRRIAEVEESKNRLANEVSKLALTVARLSDAVAGLARGQGRCE
jgi:uncharacterized protein YlxW (UPF0749 family)